MYEFLRPKSTYTRWGRYYSTVPSLPLKEKGTPFKFTWATPSQASMDDIVNNLEHLSVDETIKTPDLLSWSLDGAVVINGDLFKIIDTQTTRVSGAASALVRTERTETVIRLKRISNPIGLR